MKRFRFYKETDQWFGEKWYVDLPEWTGAKADLEMVGGADDMLNMVSEGETSTHLSISETSFDNADELVFNELATELGNGAYYTLPKYRGIELNHRMWICDVMLFIFDNKFPERLFFAKT